MSSQTETATNPRKQVPEAKPLIFDYKFDGAAASLHAEGSGSLPGMDRDMLCIDILAAKLLQCKLLAFI